MTDTPILENIRYLGVKIYQSVHGPQWTFIGPDGSYHVCNNLTEAQIQVSSAKKRKEIKSLAKTG